MNSPISSSADQHSELMLLLPWYVNQSLAANERLQVEKHLKSCLICRRELLDLRKLSAAVQGAGDLDMAADASLAGLRMKMQRNQPSRPTASAWLGNAGKGLAIAASLLLVLTPLALKYLPLSATGDYYTLASAKPDPKPAGQIRVVFAKQMSMQQIDDVLNGIHALRLDGPNSVGAYTVKLAAGDQDRELAGALALLRGRQDVILAEPILEP